MLKRLGYFEAVKKEIEDMYTQSGNTKVTVVVHSMGGPVSLYFFTSGIVTQQWKDTHINAYITLSGAWAGAGEALGGIVSGSVVNIHFKLIQSLIGGLIVPFIRSLESMWWMLPNPDVWGDTEVVVTQPHRNYTVCDYEQLFRDIDYAEGILKFNEVKDINKGFPAPNVSTHCLCGVGTPTPMHYYYNHDFPHLAPDHIDNTDGDGTVNVKSLEVCLRWKESSYGFQSKTFEGVDHGDMVKNETVFDEIAKIIGIDVIPRGETSSTKEEL